MKYFFLILTIIALQVSAKEINKEEFPYLQPISVERSGLDSNNFLDADKDGVSDNKDKCLNSAKNIKVDMFGCKTLADDDNDGISNESDKCPKTELNSNVDTTGCPPDTDADGVIDTQDQCPDTSKEFVVDKLGCPQTAVLKINFAFAKSIISPDYFVLIEEFAAFLQKNKSYDAIIYGYTDGTSQSAEDKLISQNRAQAVVDALISYGVKLTRLTAIGMGSKNPIADNNTSEGRAKNRRIEVELLQ